MPSSLLSLVSIILLSLYVSGVALFAATLIGVPLGTALALRRIPLRQLTELIIYTGMGLPPVVVGLVVYMALSRSGPLGVFQWLFTPNAMIVAQAIIALPLVIGLTMAAVQAVDPALRLQVRSLGATRSQVMWTVLWEARNGVVAALITAYGRLAAEVGAVMLVGGNIEGSTRVLTTAIVLETRQGNFEFALALGGVLLGLTFVTNFWLLRLSARKS
ncbi:MAG TPA: ABC transporter permease [Anaerolineales bacterium]|nr:ABC transporter permease [Anaerolineales bacterium]